MDEGSLVKRLVNPDFLVQFSMQSDNNLMTYLTAYILSIVCLSLTALVALKQSASLGSLSDGKLLSFGSTTGLFATMTIQSFAHGWMYEYYLNWDASETNGFIYNTNVVTIFVTLAGSCVFFTAETLRRTKGYGSNDETSGTVKGMMYFTVVLISLSLGIFILAASAPARSDDKFLMSYLYFCFMMLYLFIISLIDTLCTDKRKGQASRHFLTAVSLYFLGLIAQVLLSSVCKPGRANALGCPLSESFNHNALFHVFQIIAFVLIALGVLHMMDEATGVNAEAEGENAKDV